MGQENKIGLKTINDLFGTRFFIPSYQRGYRWTKQQVTDLLNDINEFNPEGEGFYCLQPLVVRKERKEDVLDKIREAKNLDEVLDEVKSLLKGDLEAIDGQQQRKEREEDLLGRIRKAENLDEVLDEVKSLTKVDWEVIDGQQRLTTVYILLSCLGVNSPYSLEYETRGDSAAFLQNIDSAKSQDNIDFYFIAEAKESVNEWLQEQFGSDENNKNNYLQKLKEKVKFIWYETNEKDPIKVFTRLNIGKIPLTNSELIKALFLNSSNFSDSKKLRQKEIASEWDRIEYSLQDDEFWMFLHDKGYDRPTRIDFILDLICEQGKLDSKIEKFTNKEEKDKIIGTDEYRTFRYFYEYFKSKRSSSAAWKEIKSVYQTFNEWFNDLEIYHYVGFLVAFGVPVKELMKLWDKDKKEFISSLKKEVKRKTDKIPIDFQFKEDGSNKREACPLLLFHNIQTVINQNEARQNNEKYKAGVFYKFPFHLYKLEGWDVEHINSSTSNPEEDDNTQKEWLINVYIGAEESIQNKIIDYFNSNDETKKKNIFEEVKKAFPTPKEWSEKEKNKIGNYALLDSSTNRSYGNAIFSAKRRIIIEKDKGYLIPIPKLTKDGKLEMSNDNDDNEQANSPFVPPCTKQVFLKYFSATIGDNNYWTEEDAVAYKDDIKNCLKKLDE